MPSLLSMQRVLVLLSLGMASVDCVHCLSRECCARDAWRKCHMAAFLLFLHEFFITCFVVVLNVLVTGDLRHEYAQSTWGFPFRGPPSCWLCSLRLRCRNWRSFDNDCCCGMNIVVILTMSSQRLCCICWGGCLVAPRQIATALLIALEGCSSRERFGTSQWWRWLHPSWSVMASIMPITIGNGVIDCCCLSRLCLVPMLAPCSQLGFLIV